MKGGLYRKVDFAHGGFGFGRNYEVIFGIAIVK
jgi:hypothetical protein